jgi:hypothetical protein
MPRLAPTNTLDQARGLIEKRLKELDGERKKLQDVLAKLTGPGAGGPRRGPGRPRGSGKGRASARRGRRKRGNTRADQAVKLVTQNPDISASEVAKKMRIAPNYIYRVLGDLQKEGKVRKRGRGYRAA